MPVDPSIARTAALPIAIDLGATVLFSITGAMVAIRRYYDAIGVFVLALACGLGGGLLRDCLFIQSGPPAAMRTSSYMFAVLAGCVIAILFFKHMERIKHIERLSKPFLIFDALGTGAYGVVGASKAFEAGLAVPACIFVGVVNAVGSGLIRDVLVREEPLMFKPGQFYIIASLLGVSCFHAVRHFLPASARAVCHLSDCHHVRLPSPGDLLRLEDQIGPPSTGPHKSCPSDNP